MKGKVVLFGGLMLVAASAGAQGVFSFDNIPLKGEPSVEVNLGPEMMAFLGPAAKGASGVPGALDGVTNVRVLVYENLSEDMQGVLRYVESTGTKLEGEGWHAVVRVREEGEQVRVYMKPGTDGTLAGVTVMVTEDGNVGEGDDDDDGGGEAIFLNVAGKIRPEDLGKIASGIGVNGVFPGGVPGLAGAAPKAATD
jgi:hypothetical protein